MVIVSWSVCRPMAASEGALCSSMGGEDRTGKQWRGLGYTELARSRWCGQRLEYGFHHIGLIITRLSG